MQDAKNGHKFDVWAPSHNFVGLYLRNEGTYRRSAKTLLNSNISPTCPHNMVNFGSLAAKIISLVWGTPANFNGFRVLAAFTARHCSSERQPNFVVLNRGRHLYSAERPSRWALAHILVLVYILPSKMLYEMVTGACLVAGGNLVDCSAPSTALAGDCALMSNVAEDCRQQSQSGHVVVSVHAVELATYCTLYLTFNNLIGCICRFHDRTHYCKMLLCWCYLMHI